MKDYYRVLDLPKNATEEQIRNQYKLLVRVYHPDRFTKPEDRIYAEQKIKEVNEAYSALLRPVPTNQNFSDPEQPVPVVIPSYIDFGTLFQGERKTVPLAISNARGHVNDLHFDFSDSRSWFVLNEAKLLTTTADSQLQFEVVANTNELDPGRTYKGWIDVRMQRSVTRVNLSVKVARERSTKQRPASQPLLTYALITILVLILGAASFLAPRIIPGLLAAKQPDVEENSPSQIEPTATILAAEPTTTMAAPATAVVNPPAASVRPLLNSIIAANGGTQTLETHQEQLNYAILDNNKIVLYTSQYNGQGQQKLNISGGSLAWSFDGSKVAYLSPVNGVDQIFVRTVSDKTPTQVTDTPNTKRALVWSPDSSTLGYLQADEPEVEVLYLIGTNEKTSEKTNEKTNSKLDGKTLRALKVFERGTTLSFSWHPDSINLLFTQKLNETSHVYRVSSQRSNLLQLTKFESRDPAWSPDGSLVALASDEGIFIVDAQGANRKQLSNKPAQKPSWSKDGKKLAYLTNISNSKSELWLIALDNPTGQSRIASDVLTFAWSLYSDRIAYVTGDLQKARLSTLYLWSIELGKEAQLVSETNALDFRWVP